jgi:hypothetical protein
VVLEAHTVAGAVVEVRLLAPATFAISPDNHAIYYGTARIESDIWIVERGKAP